ncbi:MAG: hypothetical protein V4568_00185 [Pseudomonadota bacterium]
MGTWLADEKEAEQKIPILHDSPHDLPGFNLNLIEEEKISLEAQKLEQLDVWLQEPKQKQALAIFSKIASHKIQLDEPKIDEPASDIMQVDISGEGIESEEWGGALKADDSEEELDNYFKSTLEGTKEYTEYEELYQKLQNQERMGSFVKTSRTQSKGMVNQIRAALQTTGVQRYQKVKTLQEQNAGCLGNAEEQDKWRISKLEEAYAHAKKETKGAEEGHDGVISEDEAAHSYLQREHPSLEGWSEGQDSSIDAIREQWNAVIQPVFDKSLAKLVERLDQEINSLPSAPALINSAGHLRSQYEQVKQNLPELKQLSNDDRFTALSGLWTEFSHLNESRRQGKTLPFGGAPREAGHKRDLSKGSINAGVPTAKRVEVVPHAPSIPEGQASYPFGLTENDMKCIESRGADSHKPLLDDEEFYIPVKRKASTVAFAVADDKQRIFVEITEKTKEGLTKKNILIMPAARLERSFPALKDRISRAEGPIKLLDGITLKTEKEIAELSNAPKMKR